jgi:undecaprenyl phosphate N,N'-diacetylbacillosamine 1-phosphate transferase
LKAKLIRITTVSLSLYNESQKQRHNIRPGITDWAQVKGRNAISWKMKFELNIWYIDNVSFCNRLQSDVPYFKKSNKKEGITRRNSYGRVFLGK